MPTINPISPETRAIIRAQMSRRGFIAGAGGLGAAGLLAEQNLLHRELLRQ
jgi:hypothetical protein